VTRQPTRKLTFQRLQDGEARDFAAACRLVQRDLREELARAAHFDDRARVAVLEVRARHVREAERLHAVWQERLRHDLAARMREIAGRGEGQGDVWTLLARALAEGDYRGLAAIGF
jgi:hypothetical protein